MKNSICLKSIVISLLYLGHNPLGATSEKNYILVSPNGKLKVEIIATGGLSIVSCNELNLRLNSNFGVIFRSYDEGIAYRFYSTRKAEVCIKGEIAEFNFQRNYTAYLPYTTKDREPLAMAFQNFYNITPLSSAVQKPTFLPVTIDCGKVKLTLLEADREAYPGMFVQASGNETHSLRGIFAPTPSGQTFIHGAKKST